MSNVQKTQKTYFNSEWKEKDIVIENIIYLVYQSESNCNYASLKLEDDVISEIKNQLLSNLEKQINKKYINKDLSLPNDINDNNDKLYYKSIKKESELYNFEDNSSTSAKVFDLNMLDKIQYIVFKCELKSHKFYIIQFYKAPVYKILKKKFSYFLTINNNIITLNKIKNDIFTIGDNIDIIVANNIAFSNKQESIETLLGISQEQKKARKKTLKRIKGLAYDNKSKEIIDEALNDDAYIKKVCKIGEGKVLGLLETNENKVMSILSSGKWKKRITIENNKFVINNKSDLKNFINVLSDKYLISELTKTEYLVADKDEVKT